MCAATSFKHVSPTSAAVGLPMTEKQKKAVTLYYLENMKQEDVCAEMGIAQQSVSNMIKRAVSAMKKRLEETENKKI